MFIGEYSHNIDEKGRLAVPIKFRADLTKGAVISKGLDDCLFIHTLEEWQKEAENISKLSINQANNRAYARLRLSGAMDVEIDKQGRIVLPEYLRKYAGLNKKVIVTGLYDHLEIWDEGKWNSYKEKTEKSIGEIAEKLGQAEV
ncbi:MAG: division/cell wall cluster transcriptional repressor MraZ [Patescibacteria group bacterium]|nr:division/cell wall cluster transcriptional repressor MraZ [Patescibacteria group bacterium]MDD5490551.1 division/cell wall cluster transcriptional repressor MraZ [Patescibacteria group bacterium]